MDHLGWIVFEAFLFAAAYLLYGIEKGKPWALRYVQTLGSVDPAARSFHPDPSSPYLLPEQETHHDCCRNEPWWVYL